MEEKNMVFYFTWQLEIGALRYSQVIEKFPQFKEKIDMALLADGYEIVDDKAVEIVTD